MDYPPNKKKLKKEKENYAPVELKFFIRLHVYTYLTSREEDEGT